MGTTSELSYAPAPGLENIYHLQTLHGSKEDLAHFYFVRRSRGNVLVSPLVYTLELGHWMAERSGLALIFVTHSDEVGDALRTVGPTDRGPAVEKGAGLPV